MAYISDSTDFSTVNASVNTAIATPLPQGAVNFYYPSMVVNTWYRYYDVDSANVIETGGLLIITSGISEQNGIIQKLSDLIVGYKYNIQLNYNLTVVGNAKLYIYSGTVLQSTHELSGSTSQTIEFTAKSTEDTIVIETSNIASLLRIDSITITTPPPTIPYLTGFTVKPASISGLGDVTFTDGTNAVTPNQLQCEAYGYTYNKASGTCSTFRYNTNLNRAVANENNKTYGSNNSTQTGTSNTLVMGDSNTVRGFSRNSIIIGSNNEISNGVNSANISGTYGIAQREGEVVLGGGGFTGEGIGKSQSSTISLSGTTTNSTATSLFVNGNSLTTIIARNSTSSFQGFEATVLGVRTGGSAASGSINDRICLRVTGLVFLKVVDQSSVDLGKFGTTGGWSAEMAFSGTNDMLFQVTGATNMNISWSVTLNLYEIKI